MGLTALFGLARGRKYSNLVHLEHCVSTLGMSHTLDRFTGSADILVPDSPLERFGLTHTSKHMLLLVACTFAGYHAVKRSELSASCDAETPLDIVQQLRAANLFADAFRAEADEVRLPICAGRLEHSPEHLNPFRIVRRAPA